MNILNGDLFLDLLILALGAAAIINGRRFYWIFVGLGGAVVGIWLSAWLLAGQSDWLHIVVMLVLGAVGVWVSFRFEKLALHFAAFVLGGFILEFLLLDAGLVTVGNIGDFFAILIGGLVGLAFELSYSRRSLIVFSSFSGAAMIAGVLNANPALDAAIFAGLAAVGMLLQSREWIEVENGTVKPAPPQSG